MKKELIFSLIKGKDFEIQTFRSGGKGGQNQNKVESGVRIIHRDSGCSAESRRHRDQPQNKKEAFRQLTSNPHFKAWLKLEIAKRCLDLDKRRKLMQEVEEWVQDKYLKIETF
jgi:protein subunit release factor B